MPLSDVARIWNSKLLQGAFNVDRDAVAAGKNCTTRPG